MEEQNFKGQLISHCIKLGLTFKDEEVLATGPPHDPRFVYHVFVNNEKLGEGEAKNKRTAVNLSCKMAYLALKNRDHQVAQPPVVSSPSPTSPPSNTSPVETPSPVNDAASKMKPCLVSSPLPAGPFPTNTRSTPSPLLISGAINEIEYDQNYIGKFNEFCQKKGWRCYSFVDNRVGPEHIPEFFCSALIGDRKFPEAKGKSKKEAKKNAALLALKVLKKEYPNDSELQQIPGIEDTGMKDAENTSESESSVNIPSNKLSSESKPLQTDSGAGDSQITFHSSAGTPVLPSRPQRRIELAPIFPQRDKENNEPTQDKIFLRDFENIRKLGRGGYGTVYRATKKLDKKDYAVKKIKRRSQKDIDEVQALAHLQHPNIVRYYHSWTGEDIFSEDSCSGSGPETHKVQTLFIQLEWCAKGTLENWIMNMENVNKLKSLEIFQQIVNGVEYIHANKLIHRDLKPLNILFSEDMVVKIADFGLVTPLSKDRTDNALVRTRNRGTEIYMAPEQENDTYENEVDIFPLGLILVELFWKFDTCHMKQKEWDKLRNAELSTEFEQQFPREARVIKLMLSKEPKKRPTAAYLKKYFDSKSQFHSYTK